MPRRGLYDELRDFGLLDKARVIVLGDGSDADKAARLELLLAEAGSDFSVTPRAVFILRHRLKNEPDYGTEQPAAGASCGAQSQAAPKGGETNSTAEGKPRRKPGAPPGNKNALGNRGGKGGPPGNDHATKHGLYRNPLLHAVSPDRLALVADAAKASPAEILRYNIAVYQLAIADMTAEIEAIRASNKRWWWLGSTYRRQEGDGELMGTGRISERKRLPREEALRVMIEARAKVQAKLDQALARLYAMEKGGGNEDPNEGLRALAAAIEESVRRLAGDQT